jgi:hypothetical protein
MVPRFGADITIGIIYFLAKGWHIKVSLLRIKYGGVT